MVLRLLPASLLLATLAGSVIVEQSEAADARGGSSPTSVRKAGSVKTSPFVASLMASADAKAQAGAAGASPKARTPRNPYPKQATDALHLPIDPVSGAIDSTGRILLKIRDEMGARAPQQAAADRVFSVDNADLAAFDQTLGQFGGTVQQWITNMTPEQLRSIELRAEANSGRPQPDLASFMVVNVPGNAVLDAARALNDLPYVEFVDFERNIILHQNETCSPQNENICNAPGTTCTDGFNCNPDPGCTATPPDCRSGCADNTCCQLVGGLLPYCIDPDQPNGWDAICAAYANLLCDGTIYDNAGPLPPDQRYDPCFTDGSGAPNPIFATIVPIISGGCFEVRDQRGCNKPQCCFGVCTLDPTCCTVSWDSGCVSLAQSDALGTVCNGSPVAGPTPSFAGELKPNPSFPGPGESPLFAANWQVYLFAESVISDLNAAPPPPTGDFVFLANGFRGGGFDLPGIRALQEQFSLVYQNGQTPNLNGRGVRVGIVEFSAFTDHEDFTLGADLLPLKQPKVILEPGQTPILINGGANDPEHGTATLGMCVAADNGFGVTGIASEAQGYFFPTLSIEEGSRLPNAMASAAVTFTSGDILNYSIGVGAGPIITVEPIAALVAVLTDLGITSVMSAGNSSIPIAPAPFETGAIVVGAAWPGSNLGPAPCGTGTYHYCRLNFSNFTNTDEDEPDRPAVVHVSGWGSAITTLGYGDLFRGQNGTDPIDPETNHLRTYTSQFNGTSGAAPMVAGLCAVLQGWAIQLFGSPLSPLQIRGIVSTNSNGDQCWPFGLTIGPDGPDCNTDLFPKLIGSFPAAREAAFAVLNGQFASGNPTEVKVIYGNVAPGSSPASFRIKAVDGNSIKIIAKQASAGTTNEGLAYLAGGFTTDVQAFVDSPVAPTELANVTLETVGRATAPFVLEGGFLYNYSKDRWDFLGISFLGPGGGGGNFAANAAFLPDYIGPGGQFTARVWTCGLGLVGAHQVWHDFIAININGATLPAP